MKVLLVTETLHPGGAEMFVVHLANALCGQHEVGVVAFYKDLVVPEIREKLDSRVRFFQLSFPLLPLLRKLDSVFFRLHIDASRLRVQIISQLAGLIDQFKPDIVHSHLFKADLMVLGIALNKTAPFRHVTTIHGDYSAYYMGETDSQMVDVKDKINSVVASLDGIVCICEEHKSFFTKQYPGLSDKKLHSIYNGYQPENTNFPYESLPTVVMEYLYCAKPVIATQVGEIPNMITDPNSNKKAGYLLPFVQDMISVAELTGFIKHLADDSVLRADLGTIAKKAFHKFSMATCLTAYNNLYSGIQ